MKKFESRDEIEAWLKDRPREDAVVLAARAALRVMPLLVTALDSDPAERRAAVLLPSLRATSAPWLAGKWRSQGAEVANAAGATDAANSAGHALDAANADAFAARASARAADAALAAGLVAARPSSPAARAADAAARASAAANAARAFDGADAAALAADAAALEDGADAATVAGLPLWSDGMPDWAAEHWDKLKRLLLTEAADERWEVWTDWYEARLKGERTAENPDGVPINLDLEKARVLIPDETWEEGPKAVNEEIARLIAERAPAPNPLPDERPTPVHFEFRDGALHACPPDAPEIPADEAADAESAWQAMREMLDDGAELGAGGQNQRLRRVLDRCDDALGRTFGDLDLIRLGVHAARLQEFANRADEVLLPEDAADLVALNAQIGLFLGQFPDWADYLRGLETGFGSAEAEQKAAETAAAALDAIREAEPQIIAEDAAERIDALAEDALPEPTVDAPDPVAPPLARRSFLRAARSALRALAAQALKDVKVGASKGVQKSTESAVVAGISVAGTLLLGLATGLPVEFAWLTGFITYLLRVHGASPSGDASNSDRSDGHTTDV